MKFLVFLCLILTALTARAQSVSREFPLGKNGAVEITNLYGRVYVSAEETPDEKVLLTVQASKTLAENNIKTDASGGKITIIVNPADEKTRVDLNVKIPLRARVRIETRDGEVRVAGNVEAADVKTDTGTIATDVPLENLKYNFLWTSSRPRYLSDIELEKVKEKSAGKFSLAGKLAIENPENPKEEKEESEETDTSETKKSAKKKSKSGESNAVALNLTTARGIILLNVDPNEIPNSLQERPLTEAAKAIVRSGDSLLTEAIRRASPKYFGDYAKTLPPRRQTPFLNENPNAPTVAAARIKRVVARVTDLNNRAVADLTRKNFTVTENGTEREILSVEPTTAPFNLVLLLDVSGSVENYVDFIRKAARNFIGTMKPQDKIAVVIFNEDVKKISTFTTDRNLLSESLDTFDAGGGTAFYDALAYVLSDTLRPLRGERTAIVILSDGDDNRSFLSFTALTGAIQESGALIYPLYVPSGLIAATATNDASLSLDPLRTRYMSLTTKAEDEGKRLAEISGGVYYPIRRLDELQKAYDDIVVQLRTAYGITFRSDTAETNGTRASPRLKIKVDRPNSFVTLGSVVGIADKENSVRKNGAAEKNPATNFAKAAVNFKNRTANFTAFDVSPGQNFYRSPKFYYSTLAPLVNLFQSEEISGEVEKINYKPLVGDNLREFKFENFDINNAPGSFLLNDGRQKIAVSRWLSPKRTRSYPYERVYNTLAFPKRAAIVPVLKDEGLGGQRDFLQWDTISLLSLLDVYIVPAYYGDALKNTKRLDQITEQKLANDYVAAKLKELFDFKGTPREWNEHEAKNLKSVFEKSRDAYREISKKTGTYLHDETALDELINYAATPPKFIEFSRRKAQNAQSREFQTEQPKEALATDTKAKVTITNALFGKYFFTCDETRIENKTVYLIEAKHSRRAKLPSENDIKDGLVKMMLYTNLNSVKVGKNPHKLKVVLRLTSAKLDGALASAATDEEFSKFAAANSLDEKQKTFLRKLFQEARENKFTIILEHAETTK